MKLNEIIQKIENLKSEVDKLRPLKPEQEKRLLQKIRLDWNYHSSKIEGNTLSYGETKALLLWGTTAQGKPLRDHMEIKGHNEAVEYVMTILKGQEVDLTEHFIREFHKIIIPEEYYVDAKTEAGLPTKRKIIPGQYKTKPNHVETPTGEMFYFASPEETPAKMNDLMKWYNNEIKENKNHPLVIASMFHYNFVRIHPFDDGNGRMSRILMNIVLMKLAYPPVVIPAEMRDSYLNALQYADADDFDKFIIFIGERLIDALELWLKAAKGDSIEELDDIDKMVAMLKENFDGIDDPQNLTIPIFKKTFKRSIKPFLIKAIKALGKFDSFFKNIVVTIIINDKLIKLNPSEGEEHLKNSNEDYLMAILDEFYNRIAKKELLKDCTITYSYHTFYKDMKKEFSMDFNIRVQMTEYFYQISSPELKRLVLKHNYSDILPDDKIIKFIMEMANLLKSRIEKISKQIDDFLKQL